MFVPTSDHVSKEQEKKRYDLHQNNPDDSGYRKFLSRVMPPLLSKIKPGSRGLDFGSGPSPVLAMMLAEKGFPTDFVDPHYYNHPELLEIDYDFITCTEVVEHFRNPDANWNQLIGLLKKGGWLAVMTQTIPENEEFGRWFYQKDETHICYYTSRTFEWLAGNHHLKMESFGPSVFLFQR